LERYLDQGYGACYLARLGIAQIVEEALLHFDGDRYRLLAWVVMPNHVHVVVEMFEAHPVAEIVHSWKSFTAHTANRVLGRRGPFWQIEYFDRTIRDESHLLAAIEYTHNNPVSAGLVDSPPEWRYSSAARTSRIDRTEKAALRAGQAGRLRSQQDEED
jgi:REP element-mobilizing transposase RayT